MNSPNTEIQRFSILSVELEPTHYKTDMWNAAVGSGLMDVRAIYTQSKNWSPDGGHNYLRFPLAEYTYVVVSGRGLLGALQATCRVLKDILSLSSDAVLVCGYSHIPTACALIVASLRRRPFFLFVDEFNNKRPAGKFRAIKWIAREVLRKFCFRYAEVVLVCGRRGRESAVKAGCPPEKIRNFPYVVDVRRILTDRPADVPVGCLRDVAESAPVLFFSGRMIERKGLPSLLLALSKKEVGRNWVLWVEGAGPELANYVALAHEYGLESNCRFLGFCQYDLHSWLIRSADIVIVPSLEDNWGIVVDEGLQLRKTVISSDATGSGYDRITDGLNGYLFPAGDSEALAAVLVLLLSEEQRNAKVGKASGEHRRYVTPADNLQTLLEILRHQVQ